MIGLDINPVPAMLNKPKNVTFIQGRVEDIIAGVSSTQASQPQSAPLDSSSFCAGSFDYIFARLLTCVISTWPELITTCTSLLASGGWLEMHEPAAYVHHSSLYSSIASTRILSARFAVLRH